MFLKTTDPIAQRGDADHEMLHRILDRVENIEQAIVTLCDAINSMLDRQIAADDNHGAPAMMVSEAQNRDRARRQIDRSGKNALQPWTNDDDQLLLSLHARNVKRKEIARIMGRSHRAIDSRLGRLVGGWQ